MRPTDGQLRAEWASGGQQCLVHLQPGLLCGGATVTDRVSHQPAG